MTQQEFTSAILHNLSHNPTPGQSALAEKLSDFIFTRPSNQSHLLFLLKGYAGTGKTSMISSLVRSIPLLGKKTVLLAPTGRAAKVLATYSGQAAHTIHRKIYMHQAQANGSISITLRKNLHKNTLFIVDEASMIQGELSGTDSNIFSARNLLNDLIEYIYSSNCRLLLSGDSAQLPPVGSDLSPALDPQFLKAAYPLQMSTFELTEVVRQEQESGILKNATYVRAMLKEERYKPPFFKTETFNDIHKISGNELEDALNQSMHSKGAESTVVITRSNKRANLFNQEIRNRVLFRDHELTAGDLLMVVKNNYFWLSAESQAGFIANGDIIEVLRVKKTEELYGFRFADVQIRMTDYPGEQPQELKILLNTLKSETASLTQEENRSLFDEVMQDYNTIPSKSERFRQLRNNPYYNALQVKFAYALTCHKTQGGQWEDVFIDQGYLTEERMNREYLRWIYTALTRASKKVYLVNFADNLFYG
jgi:exodeoxyribonuclease V